MTIVRGKASTSSQRGRPVNAGQSLTSISVRQGINGTRWIVREDGKPHAFESYIEAALFAKWMAMVENAG